MLTSTNITCFAQEHFYFANFYCLSHLIWNVIRIPSSKLIRYFFLLFQEISVEISFYFPKFWYFSCLISRNFAYYFNFAKMSRNIILISRNMEVIFLAKFRIYPNLPWKIMFNITKPFKFNIKSNNQIQVAEGFPSNHWCSKEKQEARSLVTQKIVFR
jgi:hypothetical protein